MSDTDISVERRINMYARARVGDLAIARFDPTVVDVAAGRRYNEIVCVVTECSSYRFRSGKTIREYKLMYWCQKGGRIEVVSGEVLPQGRLVRVVPKEKWDGCLASLTLDKVVPVRIKSKMVCI